MEECIDSIQCGTDLFCCPGWGLCMDSTTYSTAGPLCDAFLDARENGEVGGGTTLLPPEPTPDSDDSETEVEPEPEQPVEPSAESSDSEPEPTVEPSAESEESESEVDIPEPEVVEHTFIEFELVGENTACFLREQMAFVDSVEECANTCQHLGTCNYFLYDETDGECVRTCDEGCPDERLYKSMYDLYYSYSETREIIIPFEPYSLIGESQKCSTGFGRKYGSFGADTLETCYEHCLDDGACNTFVYDPNDGECKAVLTYGGECPAPYAACSWCMMYQINDNPLANLFDDFEVCAYRQTCAGSGSWIDYSPDFETCARDIAERGYEFFHYDPYDGDCRYVTGTSSCNCPEGLSSSSWYDFYRVTL